MTNKGFSSQPGPRTVSPGVTEGARDDMSAERLRTSAPAQDATALADELEKHIYAPDHEDRSYHDDLLERVVAALRATSQTPDAVREALEPFANLANGYDNEIDSDDRPVGPVALKFCRAARAALSTPSASADWQAICDSYAEENQRLSDQIDALTASVGPQAEARRAALWKLMDSRIDGCLDDSWEGRMVRLDRVKSLVDDISALYAHPQPQQADGREPVITVNDLRQWQYDTHVPEKVRKLAGDAADEIERLQSQYQALYAPADRRGAMVEGLRPFAALADLYDEAHITKVRHHRDEGRPDPHPQPDSHRVSVSMGDLRAAQAAFRALQQSPATKSWHCRAPEGQQDCTSQCKTCASMEETGPE